MRMFFAINLVVWTLRTSTCMPYWWYSLDMHQVHSNPPWTPTNWKLVLPKYPITEQYHNEKNTIPTTKYWIKTIWDDYTFSLKYSSNRSRSLSCRETLIHSLWSSDAIWRRTTQWTLIRVMSCCLNQYWLTISKVQWHSPEGNFVKIP